MRRPPLILAAAACLLAAPLVLAQEELTDNQIREHLDGLIEGLDEFAAEHGADHWAIQRLYEHLGEMVGENAGGEIWRPFDVSFTGGNAMEYLVAIREGSEHANIITMPGVEAFQMPAVTLRETTIEGALVPLQFATLIDRQLDDDITLDVDQGDGVYVVAPDEPWPPVRQLETQVWSLAEMMDRGGMEPEVILVSVESALEIIGLEGADLRFHPETRLLIVRGTQEHLRSIDRVLDGIKESGMQASQRREKLRELRFEAQEHEAELDRAVEEVKIGEREMNQVKKQIEEGVLNANEVHDWERELRNARLRVAQIQARIEMLQQRIMEMEMMD